MVEIKTREEIKKIKSACDVVREVLEKVEKLVKPGTTTKSIDNFAEDIIISRSALPSFKNYKGFPASICTSVNEVVVHGIPGDYKLRAGDVVSIDVGAYKDGFHGDAARTYLVGDCSESAKKIVEVTRESFFEGIKYANKNFRLSDISHAIQKHVEENSFAVIRDYFGHGIGRNLHEEPTIPNFGKPNRGIKLRAGMVLAIEPMVAENSYYVKTLEDGWTVVTVDNGLAAHYENTIAITDNGPEVLTIG